MAKKDKIVRQITCEVCDDPLSKIKIKNRVITCSKRCYNAYRRFSKKPRYNYEVFINDPEFNSYFLGLFFADGCFLAKPRRVTIALKDSQLINAIAKRTKYTNKIVKNINPTCDTTMYALSYVGDVPDYIERIGCGPGPKTHRTFIPEHITFNNLKHFVRGLFDGDGCFYVLPNGTLHGTISGNRNILKDVHKILLRQNVVLGGSIHMQGHCASLIFSHYDSVALGNFMYDCATLKLNRKFNKYKKGRTYVRGEPGYGDNKRIDLMQKYRKLIDFGMTQRSAAAKLGIDRGLLWRWRKRYEQKQLYA